ncbi:MAG TPA: hypothetical protein VFP43_20140 [Mesorhizobium sp.]|nr:hypothetical protein [Mesorhizobium sp.]
MNPSLLSSLFPLLLLSGAFGGVFGGSRASPNSGWITLLVLIQEQKRQQQADKDIVQEFVKTNEITKPEELANENYKSHKALYDKLPAAIQEEIDFFVPPPSPQRK